tara:strand:+ start:163 stop:1794 length:1632 start_codon:yes stop_codon:yes gene_type:complete
MALYNKIIKDIDEKDKDDEQEQKPALLSSQADAFFGGISNWWENQPDKVKTAGRWAMKPFLFDTMHDPRNQEIMKKFFVSQEGEEIGNQKYEALMQIADRGDLDAMNVMTRPIIEGLSEVTTPIFGAPLDTRVTGLGLTAYTLGKANIIPRNSSFFRTIQNAKTNLRYGHLKYYKGPPPSASFKLKPKPTVPTTPSKTTSNIVTGVTNKGLIGTETYGGLLKKYPFLLKNQPAEGYSFAYDMSEGGGLLKDASRFRASQFSNVGEIKAAKIGLQQELDIFKTTPQSIQLKKDAYNYFNIHGNLDGFPSVAGYTVRPKGTVNVKNQTGLTVVAEDIRKLEAIKRGFPQRPDIKSILPIFERSVGPNKAQQAANSYIDTNKTVYNKVTNAITRYNKEQGRTVLTKEHILDVDFHNKLQEMVSNFSGMGANDLNNISILDYSFNSSTGARAGALRDRTVNAETGAIDYPSVSDALIKNTREGVGVDYNTSIDAFNQYDVADKIKNFNKDEWDWILGEMINSQDTGRTLQDILIELIKKTTVLDYDN